MSAVRTAYLSAGSNLGDRVSLLEQAISALGKMEIQIRKISSCFETQPVGHLDQPWFLNLALEVKTRLLPLEILDRCQKIEASCNRLPSFRNGPRTLDLDILLYENFVLNKSRLIIPHPRMTERRFVLEPLAQIAPEAMHPVLKQTIKTLLALCPDSSTVRHYLAGEVSGCIHI